MQTTAPWNSRSEMATGFTPVSATAEARVMLTQASSGMINANVVIAIINMVKQERVNAIQPVLSEPACVEDRGE